MHAGARNLEAGAVLLSMTENLGRSLLGSASESSKQIIQQARAKIVTMLIPIIGRYTARPGWYFYEHHALDPL